MIDVYTCQIIVWYIVGMGAVPAAVLGLIAALR
jgi:hypothetical protein